MQAATGSPGRCWMLVIAERRSRFSGDTGCWILDAGYPGTHLGGIRKHPGSRNISNLEKDEIVRTTIKELI